MKQREVINEYIDLVWERGRPRIYVAGKPFLYCSFLVIAVDPEDPENERATVEQLAQRPGAAELEGREAVGMTIQGHTLTEDDVMFGFASSLHGWVDLDYNTQALHVNLSFPLLKELARAGDAKAKRVLQAEIVNRLKEAYINTSIVVFETCMDVMDADTVDWVARNVITPDIKRTTSVLLEAIASSEYLSLDMALLLVKSEDAHVRKAVARHARRFKDMDREKILAALKDETNLWVIKEFITVVDDPAIAARLARTLIGNARAMIKNMLADEYRVVNDLPFIYDALEELVERTPLPATALGEVAAFAAFGDVSELSRAVETRPIGSYRWLGMRRKLIGALLGNAKLPREATGAFVETLRLMETLNRIHAKKPDLKYVHLKQEASRLRHDLTSDVHAAAFSIPLEDKRAFLHYNNSIKRPSSFSDEEGQWKWILSGLVQFPATLAPSPWRAYYSDEELAEFLIYTGLKHDPSDPLILAGTYTVTTCSGSWKALREHALGVGFKAARKPRIVPELNVKLYETIYYHDGEILELEGDCSPVSRFWKRAKDAAGKYRWEEVTLTPALGDYLK